MPEMTLKEIMETVPGTQLLERPEALNLESRDRVDESAIVRDIAYDSRAVTPGSLFIAFRGEKFDGHDYIEAAIASGAAAVVADKMRLPEVERRSVPQLLVANPRRAMPIIAARFFGNPTKDPYLAGVTGTNGKTTTVKMIDAISRAHGDLTGTIGTLGATIGDDELPGERTTPESPDLQRLFYQMHQRGAKSAAMEVASHAMAMGRTEGCLFDVGVFTNLTQDHLDFHLTMENYRAAKAILFTEYADAARVAGKSFTAVLNKDDPAGRHYKEIQTGDRCLTYSATGDEFADIQAWDVELAVDSIGFTVRTPVGDAPILLNFGGAFNVSNALGAIGYGLARGLPLTTIATGLANCLPVPGRFQPVRAGQGFSVLVDYAHTPDGLDNVLCSVRELPHNRLIVVFGCGGDRDRTKRPKMGRIAFDLADVAIVTSDNPRTENPEAIIDEILTAQTSNESALILRESDRRNAIALAVQNAMPGDTVVIAGKGHETYQIVGTQTLPFDDVSVAREEILRAGKGTG